MMTFTGVLVECVLGVIMYGVAGVLTSLVFGRLGDQ
jgi:hypothetical protein